MPTQCPPILTCFKRRRRSAPSPSLPPIPPAPALAPVSTTASASASPSPPRSRSRSPSSFGSLSLRRFNLSLRRRSSSRSRSPTPTSTTDDDTASSTARAKRRALAHQRQQLWYETVARDARAEGLYTAVRRHAAQFAHEAYYRPAQLDAFVHGCLTKSPQPADPHRPLTPASPSPSQVDDTKDEQQKDKQAHQYSARTKIVRVSSGAVAGVMERDGTPVRVVRSLGERAGRVAHAFEARTAHGVQSVVRFAVQSGYRIVLLPPSSSSSSSSSSTSSSAMLASPPHLSATDAAAPPDVVTLALDKRSDEFRRVDRTRRELRVGACVGVSQLRAWARARGWAVPLRPDGRAIDPAAVTAVHVVNCRGERQTLLHNHNPSDSAPSLALLHSVCVVVATAVSLRPLRAARAVPQRVDALLAVPPYRLAAVSPSFAARYYEDDDDTTLSSFDDDAENAEDLVTEDEYKRACVSFGAKCAAHDMLTFTWLPLHHDVWECCWSFSRPPTRLDPLTPSSPTTPSSSTSVPVAVPIPIQTRSSTARRRRAKHAAFVRLLAPHAPLAGRLSQRQCTVLPGALAMDALPDGDVLQACNMDARFALRDAVDPHAAGRPRVLDVFCHIPCAVHGQPDYSVCQRIWWAAVNAAYAALPAVPLRAALEMVICRAPAVRTRDSDRRKGNRKGKEKEKEKAEEKETELRREAVSLGRIEQRSAHAHTLPPLPHAHSMPHLSLQREVDTHKRSEDEGDEEEEQEEQEKEDDEEDEDEEDEDEGEQTCWVSMRSATSTAKDEVQWRRFVRGVLDACAAMRHPVTGVPLRLTRSGDVDVDDGQEEGEGEEEGQQQQLEMVCGQGGYSLDEARCVFASAADLAAGAGEGGGGKADGAAVKLAPESS